MLTKREWRKIAKAFEQYANGAPKTDITESGLCNATICFGNYGDFPREGDPYYDPNYDITLPQHPRGFWWPKSRKGAAQRAIFATLTAEVS